jgi:glutamyl-tRNA reductase
MKLFVAGLSHKTAPVEVREKLAVLPAGLRCHGCRLKLGGNLSEVVLLSTCNRVELYGVAPRVNGNVHRLFDWLSSGEADFAPYLYVKEGEEAVRHLLAVASGLDSMVIGETEITGQVKQAYQAAQAAKLTGPVTNRLFQGALQTAKEIRTRTGIGRGATSVASVAVELAGRIFDGHLASKTVLVLGAGKMAELASVLARRRQRPLFLIDIAVPRDIDADVGQLDNVFLYHVDHLEAMVRENVRQRERELARCQALIAERAGALRRRLAPAAVLPAETAAHPQPGWALSGAAACPS